MGATVHVPFAMSGPDGTTFSDAFNFTEDEWAGFSPRQREKLEDGTHPLCMERYNAWYAATRPPVVRSGATLACGHWADVPSGTVAGFGVMVPCERCGVERAVEQVNVPEPPAVPPAPAVDEALTQARDALQQAITAVDATIAAQEAAAVDATVDAVAEPEG